MSAEDLIPLGQPGNEEYDRKVRAKIKGSSSPRRKLAQRISGLKRAKPENIDEKILRIVRDPEASAIQIQKVIKDLLDIGSLHPRTKTELVGKMIQAHTAIHGSTQKNLNVNIDTTLDAMYSRLKKYKEMEIVEIKDEETS